MDMLLYQILVCIIRGKKWSNTKKKFKTSAVEFNFKVLTWNEKFELLDGSYFVSDIQDHFEYIPKKHEALTDNLPIWIYVNKIESRIIFKIKTKYYLKLWTPKTMKLPGSTKSKKIKTKMVKMHFI